MMEKQPIFIKINKGPKLDFQDWLVWLCHKFDLGQGL